ncbi:MAG TPA: reverse transcriptase family protein [Candidatus Brocadiia bacterium]|nr:reverse transcriptase family protein [Candidatus Brocadiia bacterium]
MGIFDKLFGRKKESENRPVVKRPSGGGSAPVPIGPGGFKFPPDASWRTLPGLLRVKRRRIAFLLYSGKPQYRVFRIPKPNGGERVIHAPMPLLKHAQRRILKNILDRVALPDCAHGFRKGRSPRTNALPHAGMPMVIHMDIEDFFPTITFKRVRGMFQKLGFSYKQAVALASLTTADERLPQGAPTSPAIANLISRRMDSRLAGLARKFGATYTRYADDITLSGDMEIRRLIPFVRKIALAEGFRLREKKTRIMRDGRRQIVTGVVVNDGASLPRARRRWLRAVVHNVGLRGWDAGSRGLAGFKASVMGHLSYLASFHPDEAKRLKAKLPSM